VFEFQTEFDTARREGAARQRLSQEALDTAAANINAIIARERIAQQAEQRRL